MTKSSNQEQIPPQHEQITQQDQTNAPESPIPFEPASQVKFSIDDITFNDNNEVALLYPPHTNSDYFKIVFDFISKYCLREAFTRTPNKYKEYLSKMLVVNDGTLLKLEDSNRVWSTPPQRGKVVREWFPTIGYSKAIEAKGIHKKGFLPPSANEPVAFKAPKISSKDEKKIEATIGGPSTKETTGSKVVHSVKETQSSSAKDTNPSQPPASTIVVDMMLQQLPQLKLILEKLILMIHCLNNKKDIKLEDLSKLVQNMKVDFMDLGEDDEPIIIQDEDEKEVHAEKGNAEKTLNDKLVKENEQAKTEAAFLKAKPSFPNVEQLTELLIKSFKPKISKLLSSYDFSNSLPTELKELPSKFNNITGEIRELKNPLKRSPQPEGDLIKKDKGKIAMSSKDAEEKDTESDSDDEANLTGSMVKSFKKKNLNKFDFVSERGDHIHLIAEQINEQKRIEESVKADLAKQEVELGREELVDLLGIDVKGTITLKVYREDGTDEVIPNFMPSDLHLVEWRENLHKTEAELKIDFNKPLGEQDPILKLNDLAKKKRKNADDIHDYFRSTKSYKSLVQYEDHPAGTVPNKPILGMILFNSFQRKDFVSIEDFGHFTIEMMYNVEETFFRLHQGPGLDDHSRTFSSFLLAEFDKRNLNPLKQMRVIEQLRQ
ncbi:hypothetical protein Tco_0577775 [Tanacetum coccineum]